MKMMTNKRVRQEILYDYLQHQNGWVNPLTIVNELGCYHTCNPDDHSTKGYYDIRHDVKDINSSMKYENIIVTSNRNGYKIGTKKETEKYRGYLVRKIKSAVRTLKMIDSKIANNQQMTGLDADNLDIVKTFWEDPEKTPDWLIDELMKGIAEDE